MAGPKAGLATSRRRSGVVGTRQEARETSRSERLVLLAGKGVTSKIEWACHRLLPRHLAQESDPGPAFSARSGKLPIGEKSHVSGAVSRGYRILRVDCLLAVAAALITIPVSWPWESAVKV